MTPILEPIAGRIHTIILAPVTAYVVLQAADCFFETFVPRGEAEHLRVGRDVMASPTAQGVQFRPIGSPTTAAG